VSAEYGERIARNEQAITDLREDVRDIRTSATSDHHRIRNVEDAVNLLLEAQKQARRAEHTQYRRLEVRVQWLTLVVAFAAVIGPLIVAFVNR